MKKRTMFLTPLVLIAAGATASHRIRTPKFVTFRLAGADLMHGESSFAKFDRGKGFYLVKGGD